MGLKNVPDSRDLCFIIGTRNENTGHLYVMFTFTEQPKTSGITSKIT